jgi:hypothetical protein
VPQYELGLVQGKSQCLQALPPLGLHIRINLLVVRFSLLPVATLHLIPLDHPILPSQACLRGLPIVVVVAGGRAAPLPTLRAVLQPLRTLRLEQRPQLPRLVLHKAEDEGGPAAQPGGHRHATLARDACSSAQPA